jgi:hypothetical protein
VSFVDAGELAPRYFLKPYCVVPTQRSAKVHALLREVMRRTGRAARNVPKSEHWVRLGAAGGESYRWLAAPARIVGVTHPQRPTHRCIWTWVRELVFRSGALLFQERRAHRPATIASQFTILKPR